MGIVEYVDFANGGVCKKVEIGLGGFATTGIPHLVDRPSVAVAVLKTAL